MLPAVLGDLVWAPRRHPYPVDPHVVDQSPTGERSTGLVLDDIGQRAGRGGQRHVQGSDVALVDVDVVDQAQIDHIDAQLRVDHIAHGLLDIVNGRQLGVWTGRRNFRHSSRATHYLRFLVQAHRASACLAALSELPASARPAASLNAIQPSKAHFTRAG